MRKRAAIAAALISFATRAGAQDKKISGEVSVLAAAYTTQSRTPELRSRVLLKDSFAAGPHVRFDAAGFAEGLLAGGIGAHRAGVIEADDIAVQLTASRFDLRAGYTRVVWGRLDEIQPSDVVNPQDISLFFFDSREAARMPVGLVRGRVHFTEASTLELVAVPRFRRGRLDRLDEATSPFRPTALAGLTVSVRRPSGDLWSRMQGGGRFTASTGRVDWALGAFRGFRPLPVYRLTEAILAAVPQVFVAGSYPRFTMASADFETAFRRWALRGEAVVSSEDAIQASGSATTARGHTVQAGIGADRAVGGYRILGELVVRTATIGHPDLGIDLLTITPLRFDRRSISAVMVAERRFARDTRLLRAFGIYDATARNGVVRANGAISVREGLWVEATAGWFAGRRRTGALAPFIDSDFVYARVTKRF